MKAVPAATGLGLAAGIVVAVVVLGTTALALVRLDGDDGKALVPVVLWVLPALGFFGGIGWLAGLAIEKALMAVRRRA